VAGLLETTSELGGALGIALLGSVVNILYRNTFHYPGAVDEAARVSLSGAVAAVRSLPGDAAADVLHASREAYVHGLVGASVVGAVVLFVTAVVSIRLLRPASEVHIPARDGAVPDEQSAPGQPHELGR
jgi:DHA2 family multidrug resistance protein-like MFS transporter